MELIDDADTMSIDGGSHGRPPLDGIGDENTRRVYYIVVWPNMLLSLHPDYVMTHQVWPIDAERSRVVCEWLFDPRTMAAAGLRPERRGRLLGPDQPPGLGRLRAPAGRHPIARLRARPLLR